MIVYDGLKRDFLRSVENDTIALEIEKNILAKMGRHTPSNEFISWDNAMQYMYKVMNDPNIPNNVGVAIEYNIPQTSKRVDFMISGYDSIGNPGVVIIELKQWDSCTATNLENTVIAYVGHENRSLAHPSYQALSYAETLHDFNEAVRSEQIAMHPCAYLHNFRANPETTIKAPQYREILQVLLSLKMR